MSGAHQSVKEFFKVDRYSIIAFFVVTFIISITAWFVPALKSLLDPPDNGALFLVYAIVRGSITMTLAAALAHPLRQHFRK